MVKIVRDNEVSSLQKGDDISLGEKDLTEEEDCQDNGPRPNPAEQLRQTALLGGVAEAARKLLSIADFDAAVNGALEAIALAAGIDRIFIVENHLATSSQPEYGSCPYEWTVPGVVLSREVPGRFPMVYSEIDGFSDWLDALKAGKPVQKTKGEMSDEGQAIQDIDQAFSVLTVPIFIEGVYWGNFGFDDCTVERVWSDSEVAVLETAAACIGSAIERDLARKAREAAAAARAAEIEAHNLVLEGRDCILEATATASNILLTAESLEEAINLALKILGEGIGCDRVGVLENFGPSSTQLPDYQKVIYEWSAPYITPQISHAEAAEISCEGLEDFVAKFLREDGFGGLVDDWAEPLRSAFRAVNIKSSYSVPIWIDDRFWGVIGFDYCKQAICISPAEMAVLRTAAACIGSAIERDRTRKAREAAARVRAAELEAHNLVLAGRDRILEATAEASNILLTEDDFDGAVKSALRILGESVGCDRASVAQQFDDATGETLGFLRILYEWDSPGISSQTTDYDNLQDIPWEAWGIADWYYRNLRGEAFGETTDDFSEAFLQLQTEVGTQAVHNIPIFVEGQFWGCVGTDHCREKTLLTEAELAAFKTAANCVGNAIERDRTRKEKEVAAQARVAELAERDLILEATAAAANVMLTNDDFESAVSQALKIVGEGLEVDRVALLEHADAHGPAAYHHFLHEWVSVGTSLQSEHPELSRLDDVEISFVVEALHRDEIWGGVVHELPEPMRSGQLEVGVQSTYAVPIRVADNYWGFIGFDDCHHLTRRSESELEALKTLANCISNAIEREHTKREKEAVALARAAELAERDRILEATAAAANVMLTNDDFDHAVNQALKTVGEGLSVDRIALLQHFDAIAPETVGYGHVLYEWAAENIAKQTEHPELVKISDEGFECVIEDLRQGQIFGGIIEELPEPFRSAQLELDVKSTYAIPILVDSTFWGAITFDDCHQQTRRSESELEALMTLANCIASAIERENTKRDKEAAAITRAAELAERDRILEATAAAANIMLTDNDFESAVNTALQIVGEGLDMDRVLLGKHFDAPAEQEFGYIKFLHEWASLETPLQTEHPELVQVGYEGVEFILNELIQGRTFGGIVDELPEPFRSGQQSLGVKSTYNLPIMVEGRFWGTIGLDDCHKLTRRSEAELEALMTLANCIGSAIERENNKREREATATARAAELAERDRILEATALAANVMLTDDDFESAVSRALQIVGEGLAVDRVGLLQHFDAPDHHSSGYHYMMHEWTSLGIDSQLEHPELKKISDDGVEFMTALQQGGVGGGIVDELPEPFRSGQKELGVKSTYAIPIMVNGHYWGLVGLDDCTNLTRRSEAELEALKTLANCIGSAIERDLSQKAREAAERKALIATERAARAAELEAANQVLVTRDRWLETTAIAANQLISGADVDTSVQTALKTIGENLACDRLSVMRYRTDLSDHPLGAMQSIYEWDAENIRSQLEDAELSVISAEGIEDWFEAFLGGDWVGGNVCDLPEPVRSGQASLGVLSTYGMPIMINDVLWGVVAMDYCRDQKQLSSSEIAVFKTAATCIGSAIYQAQVRRDRTAQEQSRLLGRVAQAANLLLRSDYTEVLPEVVRLLGEAVACDRCGIGRDVPHPISGEPAVEVKPEWEWRSDTTASAASFSPHEDQLYSWNDGPFLTTQMRQGVVATYLVADLPEADRILMARQGTTATLFVPITVEETMWGFIHFDSNQPDPRLYGDAEIAILKVAAESIAAAIARQSQDEALRNAEKAVLEEQEKAARDRAAASEKASQALKSSLDQLADIPDVNTFVGYILLEITNQLDLDAANFWLYDSESKTLSAELQVEAGEVKPKEKIQLSDALRYPSTTDNPIWDRLLKTRRPFVITQDNGKEYCFRDTYDYQVEQLGYQYGINILLTLGDEPIGLLGLMSTGRTICTQEELDLAQALAHQATLAIQLTRLAEDAKQTAILQEQEKAARDRATELAKTNEAIGQTLTALATDPETSTFLGLLLQKLTQQTGACKTHLFLYDTDTHTLRQHCAVQEGTLYMGAAPGDPDLFHHPIPADLTRGWQVILDSPQPLTFDDLGSCDNPSELWWPETIPWHRNEGHREVACSRMKVGDIPIGYIGFAFRDRANLSPVQLEFIQALTNQATLSVHLTRLAEQSKTAALGVALTNERNRLAREIHDTLAQSFTGVSLQLEAAKSAATEDLDDALYHIGRAGNLARQGLSEARRSVRALRSQALETDTLPNALRTALEEMTHSSALQAHFILKGTPHPLPEDIQTNLLRIGQEAITNALRHAQADTLTLTLEFCEHHIRMIIDDDGQGCHITSLADVEGFGLVGMRERVHRFDGQFSFTSTPRIGTVIAVAIPIDL